MLRYLLTYSDNPFCPSCSDGIETVEHYFLDCKIYIQTLKLAENVNEPIFKLDPSLTVENKPEILDFTGSSCSDKKQLSLNYSRNFQAF